MQTGQRYVSDVVEAASCCSNCAPTIASCCSSSAAFGGFVPADAERQRCLGLWHIGVAMYLTAIAFGLGAIVEVLRFEAIRIREVTMALGREHA